MMCFNIRILPDLDVHEMKYTTIQKSVLNASILTVFTELTLESV